MNLPVFLIIFLVASTGVSSCLTSSEDYAAEVVIPSYKINNLITYEQRIDTQYVLRSQYDANLLVLVEETTSPNGLSVRIQLPTEATEIKKPHLKFLSYTEGTPRTNPIPAFAGWQATCSDAECSYQKDLITLTTPFDRTKGVSVEINRALDTCSAACNGLCFAATTESKCIDGKTKQDLDALLRYTNASADVQSLFTDFRILGSEEINVLDINAATSLTFDWHEAMRQELVYLQSQKVIDLSRADIESITALTKQGQAGHNYRIVYDPVTRRWAYYNTISNVMLTEDRDCKPYSLPPLDSVQHSPINVFYLIPLIITGASLFILVVLVIIARLVSSRHRRHHRSKKNLNSARL